MGTALNIGTQSGILFVVFLENCFVFRASLEKRISFCAQNFDYNAGTSHHLFHLFCFLQLAPPTLLSALSVDKAHPPVG